MIITITRNGLLSIRRGNREQIQLCPYQQQDIFACGDHCPLFGEPYLDKHLDYKLRICRRTLEADVIIDDRPS
jgi:hypothetical protein